MNRTLKFYKQHFDPFLFYLEKLCSKFNEMDSILKKDQVQSYLLLTDNHCFVIMLSDNIELSNTAL